jgi:hypothetical protein
VPLAILACALGGCAGYKGDVSLIAETRAGELGVARERAAAAATNDTTSRSYMLDRVKQLTLALADGVPMSAEVTADRLYDYLRTQGVNEGADGGVLLVGESNATTWKGEPFEQAMTLGYIAILDGINGDWGNVRAVANNALFQVRDLSKALNAAKSQADDIKLSAGSAEDEDLANRERVIGSVALAEKDGATNALEASSQLAVSDFELGYVLKAIAVRKMGQSNTAELDETVSLLNRVAPRLGDFAARLRTDEYNAVFVVDYGIGPEKIRKGPDGAIAGYKPRTPSGDQPLRIAVGGRQAAFPVVTDLNRLALDLKWNNFEDLRLAKSYIGTGLIAAGATVAVVGNNRNAALVGLGLILAGAISKATAGADTRHVEIMPQRVYVAYASLTADLNTVELAIDGIPGSRIVLPAVPRPESGKTDLHYVRLPDSNAAWMTSGQVYYSNDFVTTTGRQLPFILGGNCVRTPTEAALAAYQSAGYLQGMTLNDLLDLYKAEGIEIGGLSSKGEIGRHILEGGSWLYTPEPGSTGFARLFGGQRPPYVPRSAAVRSLANQIKGVGTSAPRASRESPEPGTNPAANLTVLLR